MQQSTYSVVTHFWSVAFIWRKDFTETQLLFWNFMQEHASTCKNDECFAPVTEAVWLAADVMAAGPHFVKLAFVTWRDEKRFKSQRWKRNEEQQLSQWWQHERGEGGDYVEWQCTWEATVDCGEVGVDVGVGRLWRTSSGGGTGRTTGEALDGSLLTSKTSMGPVELLRRIWYFLCPRTWTACGNERRETRWQLDDGESEQRSHKSDLQLLGPGPRAVCRWEHGSLGVCPLWGAEREGS